MRSILAALLLLAASAIPAGAAEPGATSLAADSEGRWIAYELTPGDQIRFTLMLDGAPVSAILDTGVSYSVLSRRYAARRGMRVTPAGAATVIGGSAPIGEARVREVVLGGLTRRGGSFAVAELPAAATGDAAPAEMLVGRDLIGAAALDLDSEHHRFRLLPSGRLPFAGVTAPLAISRDRLVYVTTLTLGRASLSPVVVDTGDGAAVTLSAASWRAAALGPLRTTSAIAFGIGGPVTSIVTVAPELSVGGLRAREVEVRVEGPGGFSEAIGTAGRIGAGFLQRYRVLLDPRAGRMVLSPNAAADQPPLRSTSGLLTGLVPDRPDRLGVLHVMRGSPAEASGWRAGEQICAVDGEAIGPDYAGSARAGWSAGAPGRIVALGLCGGATRRLTLASFY